MVWNRTIADDGDGDVVRLDTPGEYVDPSMSNPPHDGESLPDVTLTDAAGDDVELEPDGRPMVVNLWYAACPPCARELTYFAAVEDDVGDEVRFVGVNTLDEPGDMQDFAAERGVDYELLLDHDDLLGDELGIVQLPVTLFVTAEGEIVSQTGALSEADLRDHVAELLA